MKRTPVTRLDPLTPEQVRYLIAQGAQQAAGVSRDADEENHRVWWLSYYKATRPDSYLDPGFDLSGDSKFGDFKSSLETQLAAAKKDAKYFKQLANEGRLPPPDPRPATYSGRFRPTASHRVLVSALYELPEYMQWWQAENAFRRGYKHEMDESTESNLLDAVREEVKENGGLTVKGMREIAQNFQGDPVIHEFFSNLANEFEEDIAPSFGSVSQLMTAVWTAREHSYQQFDPNFKALRWVGGGLAGSRRPR